MKGSVLGEDVGGEKAVEKKPTRDRRAVPLDFPLEYARLRTVPISFSVITTACVAYGWCIDKKVMLAAPLILQVISEF